MTISQSTGTRTAGTPPEASFTSIGTDPDTTQAIVQLFVDVSALSVGDQLVIQLVEKATGSGDTQRSVFEAVLTGPQSEPMFASPSFLLLNGWAFKLKQTLGTARSFPWSIRKIA